jgi:hypothetical protein
VFVLLQRTRLCMPSYACKKTGYHMDDVVNNPNLLGYSTIEWLLPVYKITAMESIPQKYCPMLPWQPKHGLATQGNFQSFFYHKSKSDK